MTCQMSKAQNQRRNKEGCIFSFFINSKISSQLLLPDRVGNQISSTEIPQGLGQVNFFSLLLWKFVKYSLTCTKWSDCDQILKYLLQCIIPRTKFSSQWSHEESSDHKTQHETCKCWKFEK